MPMEDYKAILVEGTNWFPLKQYKKKVWIYHERALKVDKSTVVTEV